MVRVRLGEHRVVEIARVLAVDGDQGRVAQIEAMAHRRCLGALGLVARGLGEFDRDVVGGDGDQAHGARIAHRSDALDHLRPARQCAVGSTQTMSPGTAPFLSAGLISKLCRSLRSVGLTRPMPWAPSGSS